MFACTVRPTLYWSFSRFVTRHVLVRLALHDCILTSAWCVQDQIVESISTRWETATELRVWHKHSGMFHSGCCLAKGHWRPIKRLLRGSNMWPFHDKALTNLSPCSHTYFSLINATVAQTGKKMDNNAAIVFGPCSILFCPVLGPCVNTISC